MGMRMYKGMLWLLIFDFLSGACMYRIMLVFFLITFF